jgi:hypothetical protein
MLESVLSKIYQTIKDIRSKMNGSNLIYALFVLNFHVHQIYSREVNKDKSSMCTY